LVGHRFGAVERARARLNLVDPAAVGLDGIGVAVAADRRVRVDCQDDRPAVGQPRIAEIGENFRRYGLAADRERCAHFVERTGGERDGRASVLAERPPSFRALRLPFEVSPGRFMHPADATPVGLKRWGDATLRTFVTPESGFRQQELGGCGE